MGQDQHHDHDPPRRLGGRLREALAPHRHDHTGATDGALEAKGRRAATNRHTYGLAGPRTSRASWWWS